MSSDNTTIQEKRKKFFVARELTDGTSTLIKSQSQGPIESNINIFKNYTNNKLNSFQKINLGPTFDKDGYVISRTIIGKTDDFQRLHLIKSKSISMLKSSKKQNIAQKLLERRKNNKDSLKNINEETLSQKDSVKELDQSVISKSTKVPTKDISPLQKKKGRSDVQVYTKFYLLEQIKQTQRNIEQNQKKTNDLLSTLPIQIRQSLTRQGRSDDQFYQSQNQWMETSSILALKTGRKPSETLISKSTLFREKVEDRMMNQKNFTNQKDLWESTLRNEHSIKINIKSLQDQGFLAESLKTERDQKLFGLTQKPVQIIRPQTLGKQLTSYLPLFGANKNSRPRIISNMSKTTQSSIQTAIIKHSERVSAMSVGDQQFNKLQELQLYGISIIQKELEAFKNDGNDIWTNYEKFKRTEQDQCNEVIISNWDLKQLNRNSQQELPNILF